MLLKDADGIANSVASDQTAPLGAVWSWSALFAQAYLSENLDHYSNKFLLQSHKHHGVSLNNMADFRSLSFS